MTNDNSLAEAVPLVPSSDDTLLTTAFSLASNPGSYALLIGAGVSKGAGLPTAWDVLESLTGQVAELAGVVTDDPVAWFGRSTGTEATYETVLERLAPTTFERQALLRSYFEPGAAGRTGVQPSQAHRAITRLVQMGNVRVIVTLNFDRLIERALREAGVEPLVITSDADIIGMPPLHTIECCVIHLHGDYLNPLSMLNTVPELSDYSETRQSFVRRVLADYGLIAAGWSATYDTALRELIATSYPGRYTFTWIEPGTPNTEAQQLRLSKRGQLISADADTAFGQLADAVDSLRTRRARHPLTLATAVETAKRALSGATVSISLHDLVTSELRRLHQQEDIRNPTGQSDATYPEIVARVEEAVTVINGLIGTLAFWGAPNTDRWWLGELPRFAIQGHGGGSTVLLQRRFIAGSAMFYTAGVAATAAERFDTLSRMFKLNYNNPYNGATESLALAFGADDLHVDLHDGQTRPRNVVVPVLDEVLPVPPERREDWWQQFETLRCAYLLMHSSQFPALFRDYAGISLSIRQQQGAIERFTEQGNTGAADNAAQQVAALEDALEQSLDQIAARTRVGYVHIRVADTGRRSTHRRAREYVVPVAEQLAAELRADRHSHPLVTSGFADDALALECAIRAVSAAWGSLGRELAWRGVNGRAGTIPSAVWLDDAD